MLVHEAVTLVLEAKDNHEDARRQAREIVRTLMTDCDCGTFDYVKQYLEQAEEAKIGTPEFDFWAKDSDEWDDAWDCC